MDYNERLLSVAMRDVGMKEVAGSADHPKIELAHRLTKIEGPGGGRFTDEIPWCASIMNLWILVAGAELNPGRVYGWLVRRGLSDVAVRVLLLAGVSQNESLKDNGINIPEPTWDATALSFKHWGNAVSRDALKPGDMMCFLRDGGGHVTLYLKSGMVTYTVFGGNQNNAVCEANWYMKAKLVTARRFIV